jgi:uncharacterized membrane protein YwzB
MTIKKGLQSTCKPFLMIILSITFLGKSLVVSSFFLIFADGSTTIPKTVSL